MFTMQVLSRGPTNRLRVKVILLTSIICVVIGLTVYAFLPHRKDGTAPNLISIAEIPIGLTDLPITSDIVYTRIASYPYTTWILTGRVEGRSVASSHADTTLLRAPHQERLKTYCNKRGLDSKLFVFDCHDSYRTFSGSNPGLGSFKLWFCPASGRITFMSQTGP